LHDLLLLVSLLWRSGRFVAPFVRLAVAVFCSSGDLAVLPFFLAGFPLCAVADDPLNVLLLAVSLLFA